MHRLAVLAAATALSAAALDAAASFAAEPPAPGATADPAAAYMAGVARQPGVTVTASGLAYKVNRSGAASGPRPKPGDQVRVGYEGRLTDGSVFDSSDANGGPVTMTVGRLVSGWNEALQLMRPGDDWTLYLPPALGYGEEQTGPIPPHSVMVFRLQLIAVAPAG